MADPRHGAQNGAQHEDGHHRVPGWLLVVYVSITAFFLYYIVNFAILQTTHPEFGF